jgi:hypothetical protein
MACRMGVQQSFQRAEQALLEVAGWQLDDNTIRRLCHAVAAQASASREERATAEAFAQAAGKAERPVDTEVHIDAGKVNTQDGWRDVKVAVFAQRERSVPTTVEEWDERDLPAPLVRSVIAAVEEVRRFGPRCGKEAKRLGLTDPTKLNVLGDGGEWVWTLRDEQFPGSAQALDYWHGAEHLAEGAKAVLGAGSAEAKEALQRGKKKMLKDGYGGVVEWVAELGTKARGGDGAALGGVLNYFAGHQERLGYALRVRRGQSIGSGLVEGSIKQLLNKRMKQTGARWKVKHVGSFVEFTALAAGPEWQAFWESN